MSGITLLVEDPKWRTHRGLPARLEKAADAARRAVRLKGDFTLLLGNDRKLRALNRAFRDKDRPTNVLSFPGTDGYAGDIAIAYGTASKEAKSAGKSLADHATHLVVHGVLHLAGHDHIRAGEAKAMEGLEVKILGRMGIADPYAVPA
jgi:probable rRNA maturation factor